MLKRTSTNSNDVDVVIGAYRIVVGTYGLINDHYGVHLAYKMFVTIFRLVRLPYLIWYICTHTDDFAESIRDPRAFFFFIALAVCDFVRVNIELAFTESISSKVSKWYLSLYLYTL